MSAPRLEADPVDELTADAIRARTGEGCERCGITPDRPCYLPPRRCPRPPENDDATPSERA